MKIYNFYKTILLCFLCFIFIGGTDTKISTTKESHNQDKIVKKSAVTIKGRIINLKNYKTNYSYIQLVSLPSEGDYEVEEVITIEDISGETLGFRYASEFPKTNIPTNGMFTYKVENLSPGRYFVAAQDLVSKPPFIKGYSFPLTKEKNRCIVIKIPDNQKVPHY